MSSSQLWPLAFIAVMMLLTVFMEAFCFGVGLGPKRLAEVMVETKVVCEVVEVATVEGWSFVGCHHIQYSKHREHLLKAGETSVVGNWSDNVCDWIPGVLAHWWQWAGSQSPKGNDLHKSVQTVVQGADYHHLKRTVWRQQGCPCWRGIWWKL